MTSFFQKHLGVFSKKNKIVLISIFVAVTLCFCRSTQNVQNDFVPLKYRKPYEISLSERQRVISTIENLIDITLYLPNNHVKDGSIDYTDVLQNGVNSHSNILLPNFPLLINDNGLILKSSSTVVFNKHTVLVKKKSNKSNYDILKIKGVANVHVYFANIEGDRYQHLDEYGEWGHGIGIWGSSNIYLLRPIIKYGWGDGIYINDAEDVFIDKGFVNNNRRNGVSVISGKNITINGLLAANMDGTAPKAGVDIEPNNNQEKLENIIINNLTTYNNKQGLLMSLGELSGKFSKKININVNSHIDDSSIYSLVLHLDKKKYSDSTLTGTIRIVNSRWLNVKKSNILFNKKEEVKGNDIKVYVSTIQPLLSKDSQLKLIQLNSN
jgi:hypothetical protein